MERPLTHDFQEIANVMYTGTLTPAHTVQGTPVTPLNSGWRHNVASRYQSFQQVELPVSIRGSMQPGPIDVEELKAANQSFYEAFGALDIDRMEDVWETSERSLCVHPGWQPLVGWTLIKESWSGIFNNAMLMHFNVQYVNVVVEGDCGWVTCYEHISSVLQGRASNFGILATNIFVHTPSGWRMTAHHGTPRM